MHRAPQDAETVTVHLQVVDIDPKQLTLTLPAYLPAADLSQRIARDAELEAFWPDKSRRIYYLRARGRLMQPTERLKDLGIVNGELLHVLPEPPKDSGIVERPPEYPPNKGYAGAGNANMAFALFLILLWTGAWSMALTVDQGPLTGILPGVGLSLLATNFARHLWGGQGSHIRVPLTGMFVFLPFLGMAAVPALVVAAGWKTLAITMGPAVIAGVIGILFGWLAWFGAVEPLPKVSRREVETQVANVTFPCGICGGQVTQDVKADCVFGCGRVFHRGCYEAKQALGQVQGCAVCGYRPAA
ncbi:MAG: hypothetical protein KC656_12785 [Myxococcales bacterium]|nr:hypothetical protein [Myxococcales bacterium]